MSVVAGPNAEPAFAATEAHLASQAASRGVVAEDLEHVELLVGRGVEELGAFEDVDAARPAARAPARERDARAALVADVDEATTLGSGDVDRRRVGALEDDQRQGGSPSSGARGGQSEGTGEGIVISSRGRSRARRAAHP